ncbi:MAG: beta-ketoacyl synthase N-terminal-like domain-containing protein, partial [Myxococcota bacterium]|nr:beta-ketoacyl synthase N-terminal-like domain-containing protein [Myxococcota bacterium]
MRGEPALRDRPPRRWHGVDESLWLGRHGDAARPMPGAWIDSVDIPVDRFRVPPSELPGILPQQLLALDVAASAFEDAGLDWNSPEPRLRSGVLVGMGLDLETTRFHLGWVLPSIARQWLEMHGEDLDPTVAKAWSASLLESLGGGLDANKTVGALGGIIASRIARELRLGGPSFAISAEDASSLRTVEVAARMLQRREVDLMVVGAVDLAGDVRSVLTRDELVPWSRSGRPRPFDARADGPVVGEGAAAIVLKRLEDAREDGDRIYAVLRGAGAGASWAQALERAYEDAEVPPESIGLLEVGASGDPEGDRAEAAALLEFFPSTDRPRRALGSVRSVVGDPGAAGGLASLVKAALALFHEVLPANPDFLSPVDGLPWEHSGFHVSRSPQVWQRDRHEGPRRAGVSDRSFDGNFLHLVLEGVERSPSDHAAERALPFGCRGVGLFAFEPDEASALRSLAQDFGSEGVEALAVRWYRRRGSQGKGCVVVQSVEELLRRIARPALPVEAIEGKLAWVFPGSGNHYLGMGVSLAAAFPALHRQVDAETEQLASQLAVDAVAPWRMSWAGDWETDALEAFHDEPKRVIFGQVAHGISVGRTLSWFGLTPDAVIGYSLGESAGLFASGAWSARDLMFERMLASPLFEDELVGECRVAAEQWGGESPDWIAAVLPCAREAVSAALTGTVRLLIVNAPGECVVGGRRSEVMELVDRLGCGAPIFLQGVP